VYATPFPAVLTSDWLPPVLPDRTKELAELSRMLGDPYPADPPPWVACVVGPSGAGTSATARLAARRLLEAVRREEARASPAMIRVRVAAAAGTVGVAAGLLQGLDSGFEPRGFPTAEILAGFLRRLSRDMRPAIVVLDDIGPDAPDLAPVLKALTAPARFLPEGVEEAPPLWTILAGRADVTAAWSRLHRAGLPRENRIELSPPTPSSIRAAIHDRAARALARVPPEELVERVVARALREDRGLGRALELLRRELLGAPSLATVPAGHGSQVGRIRVEPRVYAALERATCGRTATLAEIRAWEVRLAAREGARPLPATTLWRRIVRLQAAGVIRREVRPGGPGGTRSTVELVGPVPFYALTDSDRTRPGVSGPDDARERPPVADRWMAG
jgi:hypothetical protein